jgi:hypothetical protein
MQEVVKLEEPVSRLLVLHAPCGADLRRRLRMVALDAVVAQNDDTFTVRHELPLEVSGDMLRAPAQDVNSHDPFNGGPEPPRPPLYPAGRGLDTKHHEDFLDLIA